MTIIRVYFYVLAVLLSIWGGVFLSPLIWLWDDQDGFLSSSGFRVAAIISLLYGSICIIVGVRMLLRFGRKSATKVLELIAISLLLVIITSVTNHLRKKSIEEISIEFYAMLAGGFIVLIVLYWVHRRLLRILVKAATDSS